MFAWLIPVCLIIMLVGVIINQPTVKNKGNAPGIVMLRSEELGFSLLEENFLNKK